MSQAILNMSSTAKASRDRSTQKISPATSELTRTTDFVLDRMRNGGFERLLEQQGFVILRSLPVARFPLSMVSSWLLDLGSAIGRPIPQDSQGNLIGRLEQSGRGKDWSNPQPFHTDGGDILTLLCIEPAVTGGITRLANAKLAAETVRLEKPALYKELCQEWRFDRKSRPGTPTFNARIISAGSPGFRCFFLPGTIRSAARHGSSITQHQEEALEFFESVLERKGINVETRLSRGDLLFVNNRTTLHARTQYRDSRRPDQRRLLFRMWIQLRRRF